MKSVVKKTVLIVLKNNFPMDLTTGAYTPAGFPGGSLKIPQGILPSSVLKPNYRKWHS